MIFTRYLIDMPLCFENLNLPNTAVDGTHLDLLLSERYLVQIFEAGTVSGTQFPLSSYFYGIL